jgi:hypothetical protein
MFFDLKKLPIPAESSCKKFFTSQTMSKMMFDIPFNDKTSEVCHHATLQAHLPLGFTAISDHPKA